jgi:hypothetical protein
LWGRRFRLPTNFFRHPQGSAQAQVTRLASGAANALDFTQSRLLSWDSSKTVRPRPSP